MRSKGIRNARLDERRAEPPERLMGRLLQGGAMRPTLRELAATAGCSVSTLNHYFGRRNDIILMVFADSRQRGQGRFDAIRSPVLDLETSVREAAAISLAALTQQEGASALAMGRVEGMRNDLLGPAFIQTMFEPFIIALAAQLDGHVARGEMRALRYPHGGAGASLVVAAGGAAPVGRGRDYRLDDKAFVDHVVEGYLRAYRAS